MRERAIAAAAGIPRLLERLDSLVGMDLGDLDARFAAIEATQVEYREELLLQQLLDVQPSGVRRAIALAAVYEIAVPVEAILALSPEHPISGDVQAAAGVGLLQAGLHPSTGELRYLVSPLLRPLLDAMPERLNDEELQQAQAPRRPVPLPAVGRQRWLVRLSCGRCFGSGEAAGEADIVREVGDRLAGSMDAGVSVPGGAGAHVPVIAGAVQPEHAVVGWSGAASGRGT